MSNYINLYRSATNTSHERFFILALYYQGLRARLTTYFYAIKT